MSRRHRIQLDDEDLNMTNMSDDEDVDNAFVLRKTNSIRRFPPPREPRPFKANSELFADEENGDPRNSKDAEVSFRPKSIPRKSFDSVRTSRDSIDESSSYKSLSNSWVSGGHREEDSLGGENKENSSAISTTSCQGGRSLYRRSDQASTDSDNSNERQNTKKKGIAEDDDEEDVIEIDVLQHRRTASKQPEQKSKAVLQDRNVDNNVNGSGEPAQGSGKLSRPTAMSILGSFKTSRKSGRYDDDELPPKPAKDGSFRSSNESEWEQLVNDIETKNAAILSKPVIPFALQASSNGVIKCFIVRDRSTAQSQMYPTYELYLEEPTKKLIVVATKMSLNRTSNYHLFDMTRGQVGSKLSKKSGNYLGKLRAHNAQRTQYSLLTNSTQKEEIAGISFEMLSTLNFLTEGSQPRKMQVAVPHLDYHKCPIANKLRDDDDSSSLSNILRKGVLTNRAMCFQNKEPVNDNGVYRLNFNGRVTKPSVKNFQLVSPDQPENIVCQFGKVSEDRFNLDFKAPICPLQAFSFALCQFNL